MSEIIYTAKIINVDEAARCMEVRYESVGRQPVHIGARLPFEDETLEAVLTSFAPVNFWLEQEKAVTVPTVGTEVTLSSAPPAPAEPVGTIPTTVT